MPLHRFAICAGFHRIISDTPGVKDHYKQYLNFWEEAPKRSFEMIKVLIKALSEE